MERREGQDQPKIREPAPGHDGLGFASSRLASKDLLPLVYDELRRLAASRLSREPGGVAGNTLPPTALVHEAYLRLVGKGDDAAKVWNTRGHFFAAAAEAMRRILVEKARERIRHAKHGKREAVTFSELSGEAGSPEVDMLALDDALEALERMDRRKYEVVMLRFFAGASVETSAELLGVAEMTVKRDWAFARAWLIDRIQGEDEPPAPGPSEA
jgi:RNA polymerase sigma factor (TIGR02999 family)